MSEINCAACGETLTRDRVQKYDGKWHCETCWCQAPTRVCTRCRREWCVLYFNRDGRNRRSECRECQREAAREWRNRPSSRQVKRANDRRRWAKITAALCAHRSADGLQPLGGRAVDRTADGPSTARRTGSNRSADGLPPHGGRAVDRTADGPQPLGGRAPAARRTEDDYPVRPEDLFGAPAPMPPRPKPPAKRPEPPPYNPPDGVWRSGHHPDENLSAPRVLFDLPGFDPLEPSTWPDDEDVAMYVKYGEMGLRP